MTTEANELLRPIHNRMPVIVRKELEELWLNPEEQGALMGVLKPYPAEEFPVSKLVNSPANDGPECIRRLDRPSYRFNTTLVQLKARSRSCSSALT